MPCFRKIPNFKNISPKLLKYLYHISRRIVVVFTLSRSSYPMTSAVPPASLILHPREIQILWSQTVRGKDHTVMNQGRQIRCQHTKYESTTKNATRETRATKKKTRRIKKQKNSDMGQGTNETSRKDTYDKIRACGVLALFYFSSLHSPFPVSISIWTLIVLFIQDFFFWVLFCLLNFGFCCDSFSILYLGYV